jgi:hypothetical protein
VKFNNNGNERRNVRKIPLLLITKALEMGVNNLHINNLIKTIKKL